MDGESSYATPEKFVTVHYSSLFLISHLVKSTALRRVLKDSQGIGKGERFLSGDSISIIPSFYTLSDLVIVRTITPLHVGVGRTSSVVDLPVQRDEYGYPCIYSSSLKGSLKTALLHALLKLQGNYEKARRAVQALLGPEPEEGESFESPIAILDAYLLAIPARSLKGVYVYVTSPLLLKRFCERLELFTLISQVNKQESKQESVARIEDIVNTLSELATCEPEPSKAICVGENCDKFKVKELGGKAVIAEEYFLDLENIKGVVENIANDQIKILNNFFKEVLKLDKPLLVISDEDGIAENIIERSILRFTRVRLRRETKTVDAGPWTEEYLPPKTVLHTMVLYKKPSLGSNFVRRILGGTEQESISEKEYLEALKRLKLLDETYIEKIENSSTILEKVQLVAEAIREKVVELVNNQLKGYIIVGGHETIGKGIVRLESLNLKSIQEALKRNPSK